MKIKIICWMFALLFILKLVLAITGTSGELRVEGQTDTVAMNGTNTYGVRGIGDYISGQFQYPSLDDILIRGRFTILTVNNTAPNAPTIDLPVNDTYQNSTSVTFSWTNTTDPDKDIVSYRLEIYNDSALTLEYTINNSIVEIATPTQALATLTPDGSYYWQVLANDSSKNSSFSELRVITIDTTLPTAFNLSSPANGTSTTDNSPTLEWDAATETNLDNYTIELSTAADFSTINTTENSTTNSFSDWSSVLAADTYYWRVTAVDKANNQQLSENNLSFTITAVTGSVVQTVAGASTASGGVSPKPYSFHIIAPPSITIFLGDTLIVPLEIQNLGENINLNGIQLSVEADTPLIEATLDKTLINTLNPSSSITSNLIIRSIGDTGTFSVTVAADVSSPRVRDSVKIITNIIGKEGPDESSVQQQIVFGRKFFDGNSQCKELSELLDQAEQELKNENIEKALELTSGAISKCKDLIAIKEGKKPSLIEITVNVVKENKTATIISSEVLAALILVLVILRKFIKRKPKEIKLDF